MQYIDFHTHILPEMDDGAQTVEESLAMLKTAHACGAKTVILTPHFRASMSIADFCQKRDRQFALLKQAMKKDGGEFPALLLGAEVLMDAPLAEKEDLRKLCIEGTDLLLLELPFPYWNDWHIQEVYHTIIKQDITPVMAHIERYLKRSKDLEKIDKLISIGTHFQINANSFRSFSGRRSIRMLAAEGLLCSIGSDCHGIKKRSADISAALRSFTQKFGEPVIGYMCNKTEKLLSEHSI